MKVNFLNRDFSERAVQPKVTMEVVRYSLSTRGGPKKSLIEVSGPAEDIYALVNDLRAPIEILNDQGDLVWWGYFSSLTVHSPAFTFGVDLETMFNRVAVAYTEQDVRFTTAWSGDDDSMAEYGIKEILLSKADVTSADALQSRDVYLQDTKYPVPALQFQSGTDGSATITGLGWIYTLDWRYYANATGREGYEETGDGGREIGEDDRPILAQSFQIAATTAWDASSIKLRVWKQGTINPTDNLVVSLKADNAGEPGATLASGQIGADDIGTDAEWLDFALNSPVTLNPGTTYWVHVARSGAVAASNYYMVDTNLLAGYPRGLLYLYNTNLGTWGEDIYRAWGDLVFVVLGTRATTDQASTLVNTCGQFFEGVIVEDDSGLQSNPYRRGDTAGLYELDKLLAAGTLNHRRLLCEVTPGRKLRIYEEPARPEKTQDSHGISKDGELLNAINARLDKTHCPVGFWCHLEDVVPPSVDFSLVADPRLFFVDEAEFDVEKGEYNILATKGQDSALDIGGAVQG